MSKKMTITNSGETILETAVSGVTPFERTDFDFVSDSNLPGPVVQYTGEIETITFKIDSVEVTTKEIIFSLEPEELPPFSKIGDRVKIEMQFLSVVWISK